MKFFKQVFNFYINASIHVALAVCSLVVVTYLQFELVINENVVSFVFFASITGYNFVKYFGLAKFHHRSLATWLRVIQLFSLGCFLLMCYCFLKLELNTILLVVVLAIITFFYAIPFLPYTMLYDEQRNLRQISGLKVYVIALVWAVVSVILPLVDYNMVIGADVLITAFQRFILVIVLMLPFEIRDLNYDSLRLSTIPQQIGIKKTKLIGVLLLVAFFLAEYFKDEWDPYVNISNLCVVFVTLVFVIKSHKNQSMYYSSFWVESIPIFWAGILFLLC